MGKGGGQGRAGGRRSAAGSSGEGKLESGRRGSRGRRRGSAKAPSEEAKVLPRWRRPCRQPLWLRSLDLFAGEDSRIPRLSLARPPASGSAQPRFARQVRRSSGRLPALSSLRVSREELAAVFRDAPGSRLNLLLLGRSFIGNRAQRLRGVNNGPPAMNRYGNCWKLPFETGFLGRRW